MTTVQTMFPAGPFRARLVLALCALGTLAGCDGTVKHAQLVPPEVLVAPYDTSNGDALWAVAPLGNESGVSIADPNILADALVAKIDETRGIACLPLNRTLAAMRARRMTAIRTPADARLLAATLGVDAIVVGNITAYDPYNPPKIGLSLALFSRDRKPAEAFDPMRLRSSYSDSDYRVTNSQYADKPVAVVSEHLDAINHEVQMDLRRYATGRCDADSALGWKNYLANMDLYSEFTAYFAVSRLLEQERLRVGLPPSPPPSQANDKPTSSANAAR